MLTVVTATVNPVRADACIRSWGVPADRLIIVVNGTVTEHPLDLADHWIAAHRYLGTVPAFAAGVEGALEDKRTTIIANFHDDLRIDDPTWVVQVEAYFKAHPACGLLGFGGATGLGEDGIYQHPYTPYDLVRKDFMSNMEDAEAHGRRVLLPQRVACLDGFSQVMRRQFAAGQLRESKWSITGPVYRQLEDLGIVHHWYDGALGALAKRLGWEVHYLPIACKHFGGQTAVGDSGYQEWAKQQIPGGDQGFWEQAHKVGYDAFNDVLPVRLNAAPAKPLAAVMADFDTPEE